MDTEIKKKPEVFKNQEIHSAIIEDNEYSEMENPYFSDNSSASQITNALRKFSLDFSKYFDKSDNDSSVGGGASKNQKLIYHKNVNETIEEVEDEKEEQHEDRNNVLSQTMERRRKASKYIGSNDVTALFGKSTNIRKPVLVENTDPIHEEIETEEEDDAEFRSDYNFYESWQRHKKSLHESVVVD